MLPMVGLRPLGQLAVDLDEVELVRQLEALHARCELRHGLAFPQGVQGERAGLGVVVGPPAEEPAVVSHGLDPELVEKEVGPRYADLGRPFRIDLSDRLEQPAPPLAVAPRALPAIGNHVIDGLPVFIYRRSPGAGIVVITLVKVGQRAEVGQDLEPPRLPAAPEQGDHASEVQAKGPQIAVILIVPG